jgi:hypothetical protein
MPIIRHIDLQLELPQVNHFYLSFTLVKDTRSTAIGDTSPGRSNPPGASRDPTFGVSGWVSSGGFGNLIGGDSGFPVELSGGADGSSEFIRYYPPMQFRCVSL